MKRRQEFNIRLLVYFMKSLETNLVIIYFIFTILVSPNLHVSSEVVVFALFFMFALFMFPFFKPTFSSFLKRLKKTNDVKTYLLF
jgi:hypothetical protein